MENTINNLNMVINKLSEHNKGLEVFNSNQSQFNSKILQVFVNNNLRKNIFHKPFEIFWGNPDEIYHTKLLEYFISPTSGHNFDKILLMDFLSFLELKNITLDIYTIRTEVAFEYDGQRGKIDILISSEKIGKPWAVVIENKVNGARDTEFQLGKYYRYLSNKEKYKEIHIIYLPLTNKKPSEQSVHGIPESKVRIFTFENQIVPWLDKNSNNSNISKGMQDNLNQYKNLLLYLIQKKKEIEMEKQLFEIIESSKIDLPTISEARILLDSSRSLMRCLVIKKMIEFIQYISDFLREEKVKFYTSNNYDDNLEILDIANTSHSEILLLNKRYLIVGLDIIKNKSLATLVISKEEDRFRFFLGDRSMVNQYNKKYSNDCETGKIDLDELNNILFSFAIYNKISIVNREPWYFGNNFDDCKFEDFESKRFNDFSNGLLSYYKFMQNFSKDFNE